MVNSDARLVVYSYLLGLFDIDSPRGIFCGSNFTDFAARAFNLDYYSFYGSLPTSGVQYLGMVRFCEQILVGNRSSKSRKFFGLFLILRRLF